MKNTIAIKVDEALIVASSGFLGESDAEKKMNDLFTTESFGPGLYGQKFNQ